MERPDFDLTIDGKLVSAKAFEAACESKENKHCIVTNGFCGNHLFSSYESFDGFCRNDRRLASIYIDSEQRRNKARNLVKELGKEKVASLIERREALCDSINELLRDLVEDRDFRNHDDKMDFLRSLAGPRVGTVGFYRTFNFDNQFRVWEGLAHLPIDNLGGDNNTLSSIRVGPAPQPFGITLYDRQCWDPTGESRTFFTGPLETNEVPDLAPFGFDNRTESWWFWG